MPSIPGLYPMLRSALLILILTTPTTLNARPRLLQCHREVHRTFDGKLWHRRVDKVFDLRPASSSPSHAIPVPAVPAYVPAIPPPPPGSPVLPPCVFGVCPTL
jgi:hypothetical protein